MSPFLQSAEAPQGKPEVWKDPSQTVELRARDLVSRLTLEEKVSQMSCDTAAIPRLGIPAYSHRSECLHGVETDKKTPTDVVTVFPQAIGMAATWDLPLVQHEADVMATEARARYNAYSAAHQGACSMRYGLTYYSPNINIFRDPRWGRGQETYGEDPFLTARVAVAFIKGLQGDDPHRIKIMACAKHFAVHSGPEPLRHSFDPQPSARDLYETYLPAFEAAVREAQVGSVMSAYSALYGKPCCASPFLLTELLRDRWGFDGLVISDGGAIWDIFAKHKYAPTPEATAAVAVKAGCDICSGNVQTNKPPLLRVEDWSQCRTGWPRGGENYTVLTQAVKAGLISEQEIDAAVGRELTARFRVGLFDPPASSPWAQLGMDQVDSAEHRELALKVAEESIVLLKNKGVLPLDRSALKRIAVIGPNAHPAEPVLGNYSGRPSRTVSILEGIRSVAGASVEVVYAKGCPLAVHVDGLDQPAPDELAAAVALAKASDVVVFVGGLDDTLESEEMEVPAKWKRPFEGFYKGDRTRIELPAVQEELLKALHATGTPLVFVNCSGSAVAMPWEAENLPAIVQAWYPGEEGGRAVARVLFGDVNPAGRLPVTFYRSTADLPPFEDYAMSNRTYRYFGGQPEFAFGHGLSYTTFTYADARADAATYRPSSTIKLSFTISNTGARDGSEVAQVYFRPVKPSVPQPRMALCGFACVQVARGDHAVVQMEIPVERLRRWDAGRKVYFVEPGAYELLIGGASDAIHLRVPLEALAPGPAR